MRPTAHPVPSSTDRNRTRSVLWDLAVIAVPPAAWFAHLNVSYVLVPPSCRAGHRWFLLGVTVAALAAIAAPAVRSLRLRRDRTGDGLDPFLARMAIWFSALFAGATLLVGLSAAVVGPCQ